MLGLGHGGFRSVEEQFGRLDALLHSVAYAPREDMERSLRDLRRFNIKLDATGRSWRSNRKAVAIAALALVLIAAVAFLIGRSRGTAGDANAVAAASPSPSPSPSP